MKVPTKIDMCYLCGPPVLQEEGSGFFRPTLAGLWPQLDVLDVLRCSLTHVDAAPLSQDLGFQDNIWCGWSSTAPPDTTGIKLLFFCGFHACAPSFFFNYLPCRWHLLLSPGRRGTGWRSCHKPEEAQARGGGSRQTGSKKKWKQRAREGEEGNSCTAPLRLPSAASWTTSLENLPS